MLTLSGKASRQEYEQALRAVTFENTSSNPTNSGSALTRRIDVVVTDADSDGLGGQTSLTATATLNVDPINVAPVLSAGLNIVFSEGSSAVALSTGGAVSITDADDTNLSGAVLEITSGYTPGDELTLPSGISTGISGSWDANTRRLTLSGTSSRVNYQNAIAGVTFSTTSDDPTATSTTRQIAIQVRDANVDGASTGQVLSNTSVATVTIKAQADAPVLTGAPSAVPTYSEGGNAVALAPDLLISDVDDLAISGATVRISSGLQPGDSLSFTAANPAISGKYNDDTGILQLSGLAPLAAYQSTLRSVTFSSSSTNPTNGASSLDRTVKWRVTDADSDSTGAAISAELTSTLTVQASANDAPELSSPVDLAARYGEGDQPVTLNPELALSDPDSTTFSSATVTISAGFTAGDVLALPSAVSTDTGVVASWNASTATLSLSPSTTGGAPAPTLLNALKALRAVTFASSSDNPTELRSTRTISWQLTDSPSSSGSGIVAATSKPVSGSFTITPVNDAPTFTTLSQGVVRTDEDTTAEINFESLAGVSNASDVDGRIEAFVVKAVNSGTLSLGLTASSANPWAAGTNDTINSATKAFWTPADDANGTGANALSAFTVVARDNTGAESTPAAQTSGVGVTVDVVPVADVAKVTALTLPADGSYGPGDTLSFAVSFDRAITLNSTGGVPSLTLRLDGDVSVNAALQQPQASYAAGTPLTFAYTVQASEVSSTTGIGLPSSLTLPEGSSLTNSDGGQTVDASLTLPALTASGVQIDGVRPLQVSIKAAPGSESNRAVQTFRLGFSEPVRNVDATDFELRETGTASGFVSGIQALRPVNGVASEYDLTISGITGQGNLVLELKSSETGIQDAVGNPLGVSRIYSGNLEVDRVGAISTVGSDDRLNLTELTNPKGLQVKGTVSEALAGQQLELLAGTTSPRHIAGHSHRPSRRKLECGGSAGGSESVDDHG